MNSSANSKQTAKPKLSIQEMAVFAMFGAVMYCSKLVMAALPNIHLLGMFTMVLTLVYRKKALVPLYVYVMLEGLFGGFSAWWLPYLYLWTVLWGVTMLLPRNLPKKAAFVVYPIVCALHGLCFGLLYAPAQALMFGLNFEQAKAWWLAGLPFDSLHAVGNFFSGLLIVPLSDCLQKLQSKHTY